MRFDMKCNMCGVTLRVQEDQVGSIINCPSCGQVIFVQLPTEASAASDTPPVSQETLALHSGTPEPELPDFLKPAEAAAPELAPQALAETDTVSSLAEMFEAEETGGPAATIEAAPPTPASQPEPTESVDLSFLTSKPDTEFSLESAPPPAVPEPSPVAGGMPWEQPAEESTMEAIAQSIFEPEQTAAPVSPDPGASSPPATPANQPGQPEFFLPGAIDESTPAAVPAVSAAVLSAAPVATAPTKSPSRFGVMAAVYISGVIFGLILGKFMFGRAAAATAPTGLEAVRDDGTLKDKTKWVDPKAAVPSGQLKRLGETVQIAGLSITARSVERAKVTKVHFSSGSKETSEGECLVLHLLLKNTSKDVEFAPLDPMFVRPHNKNERPTYSYIEIAGGEPIGMFDLHKFSEFDLDGQPFDALKPGEEVEAIIAAAEDSPSKAKGDMRWRVQVRAGVPEKKAHTTVVGFEFTPEQIRG